MLIKNYHNRQVPLTRDGEKDLETGRAGKRFLGSLSKRIVGAMALMAGLVLAPSLTMAAPPANDNLANRQLLSGDSGSVTGTNIDATNEGSAEPDGDGIVGYAVTSTVWYEWTPSTDGECRFETGWLGSGLDLDDTLMGIYTYPADSPAFPLDLVAENDDASPYPDLPNIGYFSRIIFDAVADTTYYIAVQGWSNETGNFLLTWDMDTDIPSPPPNDNLADAQILPSDLSGSVQGTNINATGEGSLEPDDDFAYLGNEANGSVWYQWTAPVSGHCTFETSFPAGSYPLFDSILGVYTAPSSPAAFPLTMIGEDDDSGINSYSAVAFEAVEGTTYYIAIEGYQADENDFTLLWAMSVASPDSPANDNLANAQVLTGPSGEIEGTNVGATGEGNLEPDGDGYVYDNAQGVANGSVWYRWTATESGACNMYIDSALFGPKIGDTLMGVYTTSTETLSFPLYKVAENDNGMALGYSDITFNAVAGTTYFIAVEGYGTEQGKFKLVWNGPGAPANTPPVANDDPATPGDPDFVTQKNTDLVIPTATLLANDTDADGDTLSVQYVYNGVGGYEALSPSTITFYPFENFVGTATFTYQATDGTDVSDPATVTITVEDVPDPKPKIAILSTGGSYINDTKEKLDGTGLFESVTIVPIIIGNPTPTVAQLNQYDAILFHAESGFNNTAIMGNNLATYFNAGGGVVVTLLETSAGRLSGAWRDNYTAISRTGIGYASSSFASIEQPVPVHPILAGVSTFDVNFSLPVTSTIEPDAELVASFANGAPAIATREVAGRYIVDLGFFPDSTDAGTNGGWVASTDGTQLIANALLFSMEPSSTGPANDNLVDRQVLSGASGSVEGTNINGTTEANEVESSGVFYDSSSENSVWYEWTAPADGLAYFETNAPSAGAGFDTVMGVYTDPVPDFPLDITVGDNDDSGSVYSQVTFNAVGGVTYYIGVGGHVNDEGNFTLSWELTATNTAPVAVDDSGFVTDEYVSLTIAVADLLANDTDADGDALTITDLVAMTGTDSVTLSGVQITFVPTADFTGTATFTYKAHDGTAASAAATVSVTVNAVLGPPTPSAAPDFPPAPFFIQVNSHDTPVEEGDWYSSSEGGNGANFIQVHVPYEWPSSSDLVVDLLSPDMNAAAGLTASIANSPTGIADKGYVSTAPAADNNCHTRFTLYEAGTTFSLVTPADPVSGGDVVPGGDYTFAPDEVPDMRYHRLVTIPAASVVAGGKYVLRVETLDATGTAGGPSGNGFRVRAGTDSDNDPNNGGVVSDVDGAPGTGDEVFISSPGLTLQQYSGAAAGITLYRHVRP